MPVDLLDGMGVVEAAQQTVSDWVALRNKYTMLCSVRRRRRSVMLMLDAMTLTPISATQYSLPLKIYACRDHVSYRIAL